MSDIVSQKIAEAQEFVKIAAQTAKVTSGKVLFGDQHLYQLYMVQLLYAIMKQNEATILILDEMRKFWTK